MERISTSQRLRLEIQLNQISLSLQPTAGCDKLPRGRTGLPIRGPQAITPTVEPNFMHTSDRGDPQPDSTYRPSARLESLQQRAQLLAAVRQVFADHGYWEVETPLLSQDTIVDRHVHPLKTRLRTSLLGERELFLQTSPEFCMKRMLASGADAIYQITRAFRDDEAGRLHNPEFTMIEWYRCSVDYQAQMDFVEHLVKQIAHTAAAWVGSRSRIRGLTSEPQGEHTAAAWPRTTYRDLFARTFQQDVLDMTSVELREMAAAAGVVAPEQLGDQRDDWLNLLLADRIEPQLGVDGPEFVFDYPASQAALAQRHPDNPQVAQRFELYVDGVELCNGYQELLDVDEMLDRHRLINQQRVLDGNETLPEDSRLAAAMRDGLPVCSGVALGFDRLCLVALGLRELSEVVAFPIDRA